MARKNSEERAIRTGVSTYLTSAGWADLNYTEGWSELDIEKPLVNVYVIDNGKQTLELGRQANSHYLFKKGVQIDVYMESEDRVSQLCEDILDYLDMASIQITDLLTTSGIGYLIFPDSRTLKAVFAPPEFNNPEILRWRGIVRGEFESYYPNGGGPV